MSRADFLGAVVVTAFPEIEDGREGSFVGARCDPGLPPAANRTPSKETVHGSTNSAMIFGRVNSYVDEMFATAV